MRTARVLVAVGRLTPGVEIPQQDAAGHAALGGRITGTTRLVMRGITERADRAPQEVRR